MLKELSIKNYALIESLNLSFSDKLNIVTGETGAGKSIIIEALELILGSRASGDIIRKGAKSTIITGVFQVTENSELKSILTEHNLIDSDEEELIIRREIDLSGRSKSFCNDRPITLNLLEEIGNFLVDIHGQNEHQILLKQVNQQNLLDRYGNLDSLKNEVRNMYLKWQELLNRLESLQLTQSEREQKIDLYRYQLQEINSANLRLDEDTEIESLLPQIKNAEKIMSLIEQAHKYLYSDEENNIYDSLNKTYKVLNDVSNLSNKELSWTSTLENIISQVKDISIELEQFKSKLDLDPRKLEQLVDRQDLIQRLKRKYGQTIKDIIQYRDKISNELDNLIHSQENIQEIEKEITITVNKLELLCSELSSKRKKVATKLEQLIEKEIHTLGMPKSKFKISVTEILDSENKKKVTASGWDKVEFLFSANIGEDLKPLKEIASGGELSRCMLAIKTVLGKSAEIPTIIFDEIDSGVSGPMGQIIGQKLKELSRTHQIFCITHLAQIAAFADTHFYVTKKTDTNRTYTEVKILKNDERINEIARMLSGEKITAVSIEHAKELISETKKILNGKIRTV